MDELINAMQVNKRKGSSSTLEPQAKKQKCARAFEEIERVQLTARLIQFFRQSVENMGLTLPKNSCFEGYLFDLYTGDTEFYSNALRMELRAAGASKNSSNKLVKTIKSKVDKIQNTLQTNDLMDAKSKLRVHEVDGFHVFRTGKNSKYLERKLGLSYYEQLKARYKKHVDVFTAHHFHEALYCVLLRYDVLPTGGMQAAIHEECFQVLTDHFHCQVECFASPLNATYDSYCSAFPDIDTPFGSLGSFFNFYPKSGCFEANPPFVPHLIAQMQVHMTQLLEKATRPLMFVIIIPEWKDTKGWQELSNSEFNRDTMSICQDQHGYKEGKQHMRPTKYRVASFDTSVFFLQNEPAMRTYAIQDDFKLAFRAAFVNKQ